MRKRGVSGAGREVECINESVATAGRVLEVEPIDAKVVIVTREEWLSRACKDLRCKKLTLVGALAQMRDMLVTPSDKDYEVLAKAAGYAGSPTRSQLNEGDQRALAELRSRRPFWMRKTFAKAALPEVDEKNMAHPISAKRGKPAKRKASRGRNR